MMDVGVGRIAPVAGEAVTPRDRLREAAHEFEGVFVAQLFRDMRATVPADEESGSAQEVFLSMLDDTFAREMAGRSPRGLAEALYRQLVARLADVAPGPEAPAGGE
jgi:flagellar protein FlgJ